MNLHPNNTRNSTFLVEKQLDINMMFPLMCFSAKASTFRRQIILHHFLGNIWRRFYFFEL